MAWRLNGAGAHPLFLSCSYTPVYECVKSFLNKAEKQDARAAAILRLGAVEVFLQHVHVPG